MPGVTGAVGRRDTRRDTARNTRHPPDLPVFPHDVITVGKDKELIHNATDTVVKVRVLFERVGWRLTAAMRVTPHPHGEAFYVAMLHLRTIGVGHLDAVRWGPVASLRGAKRLGWYLDGRMWG